MKYLVIILSLSSICGGVAMADQILKVGTCKVVRLDSDDQDWDYKHYAEVKYNTLNCKRYFGMLPHKTAEINRFKKYGSTFALAADKALKECEIEREADLMRLVKVEQSNCKELP